MQMWKTKIQLLFSIAYGRKFIEIFLKVLGAFWLLIVVFINFVPGFEKPGWFAYAALMLIATIGTLVYIFPKTEISKRLSSPDSKITVKVGDLFTEPGHLVVGMNDVFDTEIGDIIKKTSIQGQFLERIYNSDREKLDNEIDQALAYKHFLVDETKKRGKNRRYELGTVAILGLGTRRYFCSAYSYMGSDLKAQSNYKRLSQCLHELWEAVRLKAQSTTVVMPVVGSDLARTNVPHEILIQLIVLSFVLASKEQLVTKDLQIIIHPGDYSKVDMLRLERLLESICY